MKNLKRKLKEFFRKVSKGNTPVFIINFTFMIIACIFVTISFYSLVSDDIDQSTQAIQENLNYNEFLAGLNEGQYSEVEIDDAELTAILNQEDGTIVEYKIVRTKDDDLVNRLAESGITFYQKEDSNVSTFLDLFLSCIPIFLMLYMVGMISGKNGITGNQAKTYNTDKHNIVKFADVAGEDEAKESLMEIVDILHNPKKYTSVGAKLPKGVLLVGPPGTGKTLLAKAVAGEAGVPFFSVAGSEFVEMFVGVGAKRVRELFKEASKAAPCIVFIDEIDAMAQARNHKNGNSSEEDRTLNQLLAEMDGFDSEKGIVVLAATNRPEALDKALLHPGRFDRQVTVEQPDLEGRIAILEVHAKKLNLSEDVNFKELALMTTGASGADLANIINEGAINTAKADRNVTTQEDLLNAAETILTGKEKKTRVLSQEEKQIVAHHEVGHAIITALIKNAEPVQKITIIPRTNGALGYVLQVPEEERYIYRKSDLETKLKILLGGQAAEEVFFGETSTGSANDLERATKLAKEYVARYGMSELGTMGFVTNDAKYLGSSSLFCGDEMESQIDLYTIQVLKSVYEKTKQMIKEHKCTAKKLAEHLYNNETITGEEFMRIFEESEKEESNIYEILLCNYTEERVPEVKYSVLVNSKQDLSSMPICELKEIEELKKIMEEAGCESIYQAQKIEDFEYDPEEAHLVYL